MFSRQVFSYQVIALIDDCFYKWSKNLNNSLLQYLVTDQLCFSSVSEQINGNKCLEDKIACYLDHTPNRGIRNWEHLACEKEIDAPLDVRLRCKLNSGKNQTKMVLEKVTAEGDKTLKDLMDVLKAMGRNDVKKIITKVEPGTVCLWMVILQFGYKVNNNNSFMLQPSLP